MMAQVPQGISHQAVIRNAANELVTDSPIGIRVGILQGAADGTEVYSETHTPQSNANGLISFVIGQGANQSSDFSDIDWANGPYFIETKADPEGGTNYSIEGVSQLWSVPYALSAGTNGAGIAAGDSLVLKDEEGMTRFVLNPNTGMLKMMHNDTVWYSIEVGSPHVITHFNEDGTMTVSKGNGYEIYVFDDTGESKNRSTIIEKFSETRGRDSYTSNTEIRCGNLDIKMSEKSVESNVIRDDNGNYVTTERTTREETFNPFHPEARTKHISFSDEKSGYKSDRYYKGGELVEINKEYFDQDGNKIVDNERFHNGKSIINKRKWNKSGELISRETFENDIRQSETTYSSSVFPDMGLSTYTSVEQLFNSMEQVFQQTTITTQVKDTPDEKYSYESIEATRYTDGQLVASYKDTNRNTYNADGSVTEINTTTTQSEGKHNVTQQRKTNGVITSAMRAEKPDGYPGPTMREYTSNTYDDDISKQSTDYYGLNGSLLFNKTETANRAEGSVKTEVEKPGEGSSSIKQDNNEIELKANQVVSDGNHYVTGEFGVVGDWGAFVSNDLNVYGNSNVEGDQEVGGNLSTLLDMIAKGKKKFRIDHPQFPDTKYLQHASIESNEVLNLYSGNVETDIDGNATVTLPDYFDLINIDFRYQLTVIGTTFARAIIFSEIDENNQFVIKTDEPNTKVSWQVTAKRNDQYLIDNPFSDVVDK